MRVVGLTLLSAAIGFAGVYGFAQPAQVSQALGVGCVINGNISFDRGQRIYHMPGDHYYDATVINPAKGERWFCSEAEAQAAGWRHAGF